MSDNAPARDTADLLYELAAVFHDVSTGETDPDVLIDEYADRCCDAAKALAALAHQESHTPVTSTPEAATEKPWIPPAALIVAARRACSDAAYAAAAVGQQMKRDDLIHAVLLAAAPFIAAPHQASEQCEHHKIWAHYDPARTENATPDQPDECEHGCKVAHPHYDRSDDEMTITGHWCGGPDA